MTCTQIVVTNSELLVNSSTSQKPKGCKCRLGPNGRADRESTVTKSQGVTQAQPVSSKLGNSVKVRHIQKWQAKTCNPGNVIQVKKKGRAAETNQKHKLDKT